MPGDSANVTSSACFEMYQVEVDDLLGREALCQLAELHRLSLTDKTIASYSRLLVAKSHDDELLKP
jgi:hypothetical protein